MPTLIKTPWLLLGNGEMDPYDSPLLGGSCVVISRVISRVTILITLLRGLITPLIATYEPPSKVY